VVLLVITLAAFFGITVNPDCTLGKNFEFLRLLTPLACVPTVVLGLWLFIRWVCCWRNFRRFLFAVACMVTVVGLLYAEEDWRGSHDLEKFKSDWNAKGEKFDFDAIVPPAVPDAENFAMAPIFDTTCKLASRKWRNEHQNHRQGVNQPEWDVPLVNPLDISMGSDGGPDNAFGDWRRAQKSDLTAWQNYYRALAAKTNTYPVSPQSQSPAQDVLLALSPFDSVLGELRQAAARPESRFPLDYDDEDPAEILLPHLAALKRCSQILELRALAELASGDSDKALEDVKLNLRLVDAVRTEPFIITHLVRIAMLQLTLQPVWEGLAEHKWSDAQLTELEAELARLDFLADYQLSVRGERAMHIKVVDWLEQKRSRYQQLGSVMDSDERQVMNNFGLAVEVYLMPKGWYYQNELTIARLDQEWVLPAADVEHRTMSPKMISLAKTNIDLALQPQAFNRFARLLVPSLVSYAKKAAYAQNAVNLARTAMALERCRLAKGAYPESLEGLAPQYIAQAPNDVIGGGALKYRHEANGAFVLYSVGWNETDDGGTLVYTHKEPESKWDKEVSSSNLDLDQGDWVWKYSQ
jgi:hypothetical protein